MFPGMDPRAMQAAMKKLGMKQEEVEAIEVIIRCADKEIVIENPQVSKVIMMGQETWQVVGSATERSRDSTPQITDDDVQTVVEQTGCSEDEARAVITECKGDLAEAILKLSEKE